MQTPASLAAQRPQAYPSPLANLLTDRNERRRVAWLLVVVVVAVLLRLLTWNPVADGPWGRAARISLLGGGAAVGVWGLIRAQTGSRSHLPLACAVVTLLVSDSVHYARLAHPSTRGGAIIALEATFADDASVRRRWDLETSGGGRARVEGGALVLESPPGGSAYAVARLGEWPSPHRNWLLPVGLLELPRVERVSWRATAVRSQPFYVIFEARRLLVQLVGYGVHVTYPDDRGASRGFELPHPAGSDSRPHEWLLTRDTREIVLAIDGQVIWRAPQREELSQVRLGEPKADPQHGGRLRLEAASYTASLALTQGT